MKLDKVNWDNVLRTNLDSLFNMTKPLCDGMVERGFGDASSISRPSSAPKADSARPTMPPRKRVRGMALRSRLRSRSRRVGMVNTVSPGFYRHQDGDGGAARRARYEDHPADSGRQARPARHKVTSGAFR